ncbi:hypothetical protein L596_009822 [Steinernema carpocapsae]|uniref:Uncharacterized protein n=1 Tax=Steinernema carpocapsae TaxID=34508 RepID=A0A4U5PGT0_STECR|nr:hypothetical protein L596_009822 [Steinernema carpocapsae]
MKTLLSTSAALKLIDLCVKTRSVGILKWILLDVGNSIKTVRADFKDLVVNLQIYNFEQHNEELHRILNVELSHRLPADLFLKHFGFVRKDEIGIMRVTEDMRLPLDKLFQLERLSNSEMLLIDYNLEIAENEKCKKEGFDKFLLERYTHNQQRSGDGLNLGRPLSPLPCQMLHSTIADFCNWSNNAHLQSTVLIKCIPTSNLVLDSDKRLQLIYQKFCGLMDDKIKQNLADFKAENSSGLHKENIRNLVIEKSVMEMSSWQCKILSCNEK